VIRKPVEGKPRERTIQTLEELGDGEYETGITGINGAMISEILGISHMPNAVAVIEGIRKYHPDARTVFDIGKENSSHYSLRDEGGLVLKEFATNPLCGAGGGALIEKMARRLGLSLDDFVSSAFNAEVAANISARCAVFAESDVVHHFQRGTRTDGIAAGLCNVLARNFVNGICKGKQTEAPIYLLGGVGMNKAVVKFLEVAVGNKIIIPEDFLYVKAAGCAHYASQRFQLRDMAERLRSFRRVVSGLPPLELMSGVEVSYEIIDKSGGNEVTLSVNRDYILSEKNRVYLGLDVGSVSTKAVLLDQEGRFILGLYERTSGKPLNAVSDVMKRIGGLEFGGKKVKQLVDKEHVLEAGVTGSGREIAADWISDATRGRAVVKNEITAQARGARYFFPDVDTVFEIGGQDSKYIRIQDGRVIDNEMNKVCAASTGAFLEEQARILGISIRGDFARLALAARNPCDLSEQCAVFMASSLLSYQDSPLEDRCAGLAYAICRNYLNRVAKEVGNNIVFQGAVAFNQAVVAGFETLLERRVRVPRYPDLTGAIGIAMIAKQNYEGGEK